MSGGKIENVPQLNTGGMVKNTCGFFEQCYGEDFIQSISDSNEFTASQYQSFNEYAKSKSLNDILIENADFRKRNQFVNESVLGEIMCMAAIYGRNAIYGELFDTNNCRNKFNDFIESKIKE